MKQLGLMSAIKSPHTLNFYQYTLIHEHVGAKISGIMLSKPNRNINFAACHKPGRI
jgi:hypothetical protein